MLSSDKLCNAFLHKTRTVDFPLSLTLTAHYEESEKQNLNLKSFIRIVERSRSETAPVCYSILYHSKTQS